MAIKQILIPDIGDFEDVPIIDVYIKVGDVIASESSVVALESEKAVLDVPSPYAGTITKVLLKEGDTVSSGDIMAEIETDKATMEFEAVDEGTIVSIAVPEGTDGVKVGTVIAVLAGEGEDASAKPVARAPEAKPAAIAAPAPVAAPAPAPVAAVAARGDRVIASPLAKRIAEQKGVDLKAIKGSGPNGRIVKADVEAARPGAAPAAAAPAAPVAAAPVPDFGIPYEAEKLNNVRKTIARRLTEAKQTIPHIYLTVDVRLGYD